MPKLSTITSTGIKDMNNANNYKTAIYQINFLQHIKKQRQLNKLMKFVQYVLKLCN